MVGGNQPREHFETAACDAEIVVAAAEIHAAILEHAQAPPVSAVFGDLLLEADHPVRDALHLQAALAGGQIIQQEHGAAATGEEVLEREHLPPVARRVPGEEL